MVVESKYLVRAKGVSHFLSKGRPKQCHIMGEGLVKSFTGLRQERREHKLEPLDRLDSGKKGFRGLISVSFDLEPGRMDVQILIDLSRKMHRLCQRSSQFHFLNAAAN